MFSEFKSAERTNFFEQSGLPFWDGYFKVGEKKLPYAYLLYECHRESKDRIAKIQEASVGVAKVFDKVASLIKQWSRDDLKRWGFSDSFYDLHQTEWDKVFCMRIGWAWQASNLKFMEINSEKPTFWIEPEMANGALAEHFGLQNPSPNSPTYLRRALNQAIDKSINTLAPERRINPKIGFVTRENPWDIDTMHWLTTFCEYDSEVFGIESLDFAKRNNVPINRRTQSTFDALIFWYPIEYLVDDKFENGDSVCEVFTEGIKQKSFAVVHAIPAFFIQPKSILAYITENSKHIFTGELKKYEQYFPLSYMSPEKLGGTYFAKPIWGREGQGCSKVDKGVVTRGRYQEDYFSRQKKVYQEVLNLESMKIKEKDIVIIHEAWVYRVGKKFVPGAVGIRGSKHIITDDTSYCLPIGI